MIKLKISGMTCNHCVMAVTKALEGVPGARQVRVSLERNEATVEGSPKPNDLIAVLAEEGYGAEQEGA